MNVRHFSSDTEVIAVAETGFDGQLSVFLGGDLQKLEQRAKQCIELRWEYVELIPSLVVVACFVPGRARDLPAPLVPGFTDRKNLCTLTLIAKLPGPNGDLFLQFEFPFVCRRITSLSTVTKTEPTGSSGIFTAGSEIIAFVMYRNCASVSVKARMLQRKTSAFCDQLRGLEL